jgi:hypothetical protein
MLSLVPQRPVQNGYLSTAAVHCRNGLVEPRQAVFPVVHTLYDYDERF